MAAGWLRGKRPAGRVRSAAGRRRRKRPVSRLGSVVGRRRCERPTAGGQPVREQRVEDQRHLLTLDNQVVPVPRESGLFRFHACLVNYGVNPLLYVVHNCLVQMDLVIFTSILYQPYQLVPGLISLSVTSWQRMLAGFVYCVPFLPRIFIQNVAKFLYCRFRKN